MQRNTSQEMSAEIKQVLSVWRKKTLNNLYIISLAASLIGFFIVLFSDVIPNQGRGSGLVFYGISLAVIAFFALRQDLDQELRAWVFLGIFFVLAVLALLRGGLAGDGRLFILALPVLATILLGINAAIIITGVGFFILIVFSVLANTSLLEPYLISVMLNVPHAPSVWLTETSYTILIMTVLLVLIGQFSQYMVRTIETRAPHPPGDKRSARAGGAV